MTVASYEITMLVLCSTIKYLLLLLPFGRNTKYAIFFGEPQIRIVIIIALLCLL